MHVIDLCLSVPDMVYVYGVYRWNIRSRVYACTTYLYTPIAFPLGFYGSMNVKVFYAHTNDSRGLNKRSEHVRWLRLGHEILLAQVCRFPSNRVDLRRGPWTPPNSGHDCLKVGICTRRAIIRPWTARQFEVHLSSVRPSIHRHSGCEKEYLERV